MSWTSCREITWHSTCHTSNVDSDVCIELSDVSHVVESTCYLLSLFIFMTALCRTCCYYAYFTSAESCCISPEGILTVSSQGKNEHLVSLALPHPNCLSTAENPGVSEKPTVVKYPYLPTRCAKYSPDAVQPSILTHLPHSHVWKAK